MATAQGCASVSSLPPPLVVFADGCGASTAVIALASRLLQRHGIRAALPVYEPMICAQNQFCAAGNVTAMRPIVAALHEEVRWAAARCRTVLLKGHCGMDDAWRDYAAALKAMGARVVASYRRNVLDVAICEIRDCLVRDARLGHPVARVAASAQGGHLSGASTGFPRANCSIARRALAHEAQPLVWLDPRRVVAALRTRLFRNAQACVRSSWPDAPRFSSDQLLEYQQPSAGAATGRLAGGRAAVKASFHRRSEARTGVRPDQWLAAPVSAGTACSSAPATPPSAADVAAALNVSAKAWSALLSRWLTPPHTRRGRPAPLATPRPPSVEQVRQYLSRDLVAHPDARIARPRRPHCEVVANAAAVRAALHAAGPQLARLWRD